MTFLCVSLIGIYLSLPSFAKCFVASFFVKGDLLRQKRQNTACGCKHVNKENNVLTSGAYA